MNVLELAKYPFLDEAREYAANNLDLTFDQLEDVAFEPLWDKAVYRVLGVFNREKNQNSSVDLYKSEQCRTEILTFPLATSLVSCVDDERLRRTFALTEAKRAKPYLEKESLSFLVGLARHMGVSVEMKNDDIEMPLADYLMYTTAFRGIAKWRLANRLVTEGRVTVGRLDFARINEEVIRERVYEKTLKHFSPSDLPQRGKEAVERIRDSWAKMNFRYPKKVDAGQVATPPCIAILKKRIESGQNLFHIERLALATYLINTNKEVEDILQLFSSSPDFDIKVARYQIEHLAGLRGSRKKYTPPNCDAMRKFSLCFPDSGCNNLRNPIQYKGVPK